MQKSATQGYNITPKIVVYTLPVQIIGKYEKKNDLMQVLNNLEDFPIIWTRFPSLLLLAFLLFHRLFQISCYMALIRLNFSEINSIKQNYTITIPLVFGI